MTRKAAAARGPARAAALALAGAVVPIGWWVATVPAHAQVSTGAASWPIVGYLDDTDIARADEAIATAGQGPPGTTAGFYNPATGLNGTVTANAATAARGRANCRTFQVTAFVQPQYRSSWVIEPRFARDPFQRERGPVAVERQTQTRQGGNPRFAWTACRGPNGVWTPQ